MAVIATVDDEGQPSTSMIFYIVANNSKIKFLTKSETQKHTNLKNNPKVALTIVGNKKPITLSLEGSAIRITEDEEHHSVLQAIAKLGSEMLGDYAPIIKLHKGKFVAYEFIPSKGKLTDFTNKLANTKEQLQDF